jgi:hypothetical protein
MGVAICDEHLRFVALNSALATMNGVPLKHHLGRQVREVVGEVARILEPKFESILEGRCAVMTFEVIAKLPHRNAPSRWLEEYFPVIRKGKIKAAAVFVTEVGCTSFESLSGLTAIVAKHPLISKEVVLSAEISDCFGRSERAIREQVSALIEKAENSRKRQESGAAIQADYDKRRRLQGLFPAELTPGISSGLAGRNYGLSFRGLTEDQLRQLAALLRGKS